MDVRFVFPPATLRVRPDPAWIAGVAAIAKQGADVNAEDANARFWTHVLGDEAAMRHVEPLRRLWAAFEARGRLSADDAARYGTLAEVVPVLAAADAAPAPIPDTPAGRTLDALRASAVWLALDGDRLAHPVPAAVPGLERTHSADAPTLYWLAEPTQRGPLLAMLGDRTGRHPHLVVDAGGGPVPLPPGVSGATPETLGAWLAAQGVAGGEGRVTWHGSAPADSGAAALESLRVVWKAPQAAPALPAGNARLRRAPHVLVVRRRHAGGRVGTSAGTGRTAPEQIHAGLRPAAGLAVAYVLATRVRAGLSPFTERLLAAFDPPRALAGALEALAEGVPAPSPRARVEADVRALLGAGVLEVSGS